MKCVNPKHSGIESDIRFQKFSKHAAMSAATARERNVWMPRSQIGGETDSERRVLDAFVKLKKMRMACANADPDNFRRTFGGKCSDSFDRQKESVKLNRLEFFAQCKVDILRHVGEKPECEMHLIADCPTHAANVRIKIGQDSSN